LRKVSCFGGYFSMADTPSESTTRPSLLVRLRDASDTQSWQTFVEIYAPLLYCYCRKQGLQDADAADISQEVLTQVARSIATFEYRPERGRFRDWLGTVTRNRIIRARAKQTRAGQASGGPDHRGEWEDLVSPEAGTEWTAEFNAQLLRVSMERIRPHFEEGTWAAFEHVWLKGQPAPQVAAELAIPIDAVYAAKSRVLKRLKEEVLLLAEDVPHMIS
jgi:RNA polymerase sigma-70 factor (ECF subfamily)